MLVVILFGAAGALFSFLGTAEYNASTLVQVDATEITPTVNGDEVDDQEIATQRLVMNSDVVAQRVVDALQLSISVDTLQKEVTVEQVNDSRVLRLTAVSSTPEGAATVANSFAEQYLEYRNEERDARLDEIGSTGENGLRPAPGGLILNPAVVRNAPSGPSLEVIVALTAVLGLVLGLLLAYVRETRRMAPKNAAG